MELNYPEAALRAMRTPDPDRSINTPAPRRPLPRYTGLFHDLAALRASIRRSGVEYISQTQGIAVGSHITDRNFAQPRKGQAVLLNGASSNAKPLAASRSEAAQNQVRHNGQAVLEFFVRLRFE